MVHDEESINAEARAPEHLPVMLDEVLDLLAPAPGEVFADATAGLGGHASAIATHLGATGTVILNDLDRPHLSLAEGRIREACDAQGKPCPKIVPIHGPFSALPARLRESGLVADLLLADLGFASDQVGQPDRGFSFANDGPLDMRYDQSTGVPASTLINDMTEKELASIIFELGEERASRRIARRIVEQRAIKPIETTAQLATIVRRATGGKPSRIDPATRTFQALRIAANDELGNLRSLLASIASPRGTGSQLSPWLAPDARVAIIAFHSLEDRPVKRGFRDLCDSGRARALCRGACKASVEEIEQNRRSRSARLRSIRLSDSAPSP